MYFQKIIQMAPKSFSNQPKKGAKLQKEYIEDFTNTWYNS